MKRLNLILILLPLIIASCSADITEIYIIDEIKVYDSVAENEKIGKDLVSYDYVGIITTYLKITDKEVLKNVAWEYFVENNSQKITFRLILNEESKLYKDELVSFFKKFIDDKLKKYSNRKNYLDEVVIKSDEFIRLINNDQYDSLLQQASPTFIQPKDHQMLYKVFDDRKINFHPIGERIILGRQVYSDLGNGIKGEFYIIKYKYKNDFFEEVATERVDGKIKLIGYKYIQ